MEVRIDLRKIRYNVSIINDICHKAGLQIVWVSKGCHSEPEVIRVLGEMKAEIIGEVYLSNLQKIREIFPGELMMIHFPALTQAKDAVSRADIIVISNTEHAEALSSASQGLGKKQRLILMVDVGNTREGVMPREVLSTVRKILSFPGIELIGLGTSIGCYAGYCAGEDDLNLFLKVARETEEAMKYRLQVLSVGSGTMLLDLIRTGKMPKRINQVRIGAALLVGEKPPTKEPIIPLYQDCFVFRGEILEIFRKPSLPIGPTGYDAFGRKVVFENKGERDNALLNFGVIDVDIYDLTPQLPGVRIIGGTSNYTVCDVTDSPEKLKVGQYLDFRMAYSAMARATSSRYVRKTILDD
jgi:predicted amino acid racemase